MPKRIRVDEPERLGRFLANTRKNSEEFKALVLKLVAQFDDVAQVSQLTTVPESTIYDWLADWNKKKSQE